MISTVNWRFRGRDYFKKTKLQKKWQVASEKEAEGKLGY
jgi:hypothetical protein